MAAGLAGSIEPIYGYQLPPVPFGLVDELPAELAPGCVCNGLRQLMVLYHIARRKVFDADYIILAYQLSGQLLLHNPSLICDMFM